MRTSEPEPCELRAAIRPMRPTLAGRMWLALQWYALDDEDIT